MTKRLLSATLAAVLAVSMHAFLGAQSPHGAPNAKLQPGPNTNAAGGVVRLDDPAALVKVDLNEQRQNETVVAASTRNPDHLIAAANDYRFVDFPQADFFGGSQNFFARLIAKLFGRPSQRPPVRAAMSVGAWTGVYRSCDRGRTWIGSAVPGGPLDLSEASMASPLKVLTNDAIAAGGHAETTDPVVVAGPGGRMHMVVLGFVRFPNGAVGDSRMYYVSYTDRNNHEGGTCFNYDFTRVIDTAGRYQTSISPAPFIDKPSMAAAPDGTLYVAYTVFLDAVKSKVVVARSTDGGGTWSRTIPLLNLGFLRNHGTTLTIDQLNGTVYLSWRMFYDDWPLMVISKSYNKGRTFWPATPISHFWPAKSLKQIVQQLKAAKLQPFDQFSVTGSPDAVTARALGFPTVVAGVVNGQSKLFAAWTERADMTPGPNFGKPSATGTPRIMFMMSSDGGWTWTERRAIDAGDRTEHEIQAGVGPMGTRPSGPQVQPVLSLSGQNNPQLLLMYYESRQELAAPYENNFLDGIEREMDVRAARINPVTGQLAGASVQVSYYPVKANSSPAEPEETAPGYRKNHRENLQMYSGGFAAFFGDYPGVSPSRPFEYNNSGWRWASDASTSLTAFTDNRDAEFPLGVNGLPDIRGDWTAYTPLVPTNPADKPAECAHVAMRNANPYFTEIGGLVAGAPQTFKRLTIQRAFATYVENRTPQDRFFRLTIQDNEAAGIDGSFDQFLSGNGADALDVKVFANSSQHRTVWVQPLPGNPTASLQILVREITDIGGALVGNGLRSRVVLNPDPNNDAPTTIPPLAPPYAGNGNITADNSEIHDPQISSPQIATFRVGAPQISSPQISSPQIATLGVPQISSNSTAAPQISSPQIATPGPDAGDENGTDVTYVVTNEGTTNTNYDAIFNVPNVVELMQDGHYQFQVIVSKTSRQPGHFKQPGGGCEPATKAEEQVITSIPVPQIATPQIATIQNPQIASPQIATPQIATFSLGPAGGAEGQNSHGDEGNEDSHSTQLPESVNLTLRAIRLKAGGPNFDPTTVQVRVKSLSTNVVLGVVGADGTQPSAFGQPDLLVINYTAASPALSAAAGDDVVLSSWTLKNQGGGFTLIEGAVHIGIYLSDDPIITASDTLLSTDSVGSMTAGQEIDFSAPTVEIPAETEPGDYYIGILVDRFDTIEESNEDNNYVSEPITITSGVACLAPPSGMISWWPGDGTGDDIKDGNTAFDWGGIDYAAGKVGPAFTFNGDGQYLAVEGDASLRPTTLTVDFWFKSDEDLDGDITIRPFVVNLDDGDTITFFSKGYDFFYRLGALHFRLRSSLGSGIEVTHTVDIAAGGWHHVAGTFDGDMQRLYLDGVQVGTAVDWSSLDASLEYIPADILLGKVTIGSDVVSDFFFDGQIDEIELFDRALSSDEIADLYAADSDGKCKLESLNLLVVDGDSDLEATVIKRFEEDGTPLGKMSRLSPFGCIQDLAVKDGDVYAADTCNERIVRISPDGTQTDFFVDTNPDLFFSPEALAFDAGPGNLFVADSYNDMIYRITPAGVRTEFLDLDEDDPDRIDIKTFENDLIVAYDEFIYPSDTFGTILRVDPTGVNVDAVISDGAFGVAGLEVAADAGFYVVADDVNHRLIKINAESGALTVFSSDELFCCDMSGMARDDDGNLIMAVSDDEGVFRLISVSPTAVITLLHEGDPLLFPRRVAIYRP